MRKYQSSRGWRNNNPLNIRKGEKWLGLVEKPTDNEFCQFISMSFGYRAAYKILKSYARYFRQRGKDCTIRNILERWAPPSENDTEAYIVRVCDILLASPSCTIDPGRCAFEDKHTAWLMAAMTCVECGCEPQSVNYKAIVKGIMLGGGHELKLEDVEL